MMNPDTTLSTAILDWLAGIGAAGNVDIATVAGIRESASRRRLRVLEAQGMVRALRVLHGAPPLYLITGAGLRAVGRRDLAPPRLNTSGFAHQAQCARVAAALVISLAETHDVHGERELRVWERSAPAPLASVEVGFTRTGEPERHRPDLICLPRGGGPPVAIEVELTVKAPLRLRRIIRGWARTRLLNEVVYYAPAGVGAALARAIAAESAGERVRVVALERAGDLGSTSSIPSVS